MRALGQFAFAAAALWAGQGQAGRDLLGATLDICLSHLTSTEVYVDELQQLGWQEVTGQQGQAVVDRTNWVTLPMIEAAGVDLESSVGTRCWGMPECFGVTLGPSPWVEGGQTFAFVQNDDALLISILPDPGRDLTEWARDVVHCDMISAGTRTQDSLEQIAEPWLSQERAAADDPQWPPNGGFASHDLGSVLSFDWNPGVRTASVVRPYTITTFYLLVPDQVALAQLGLSYLDYASGFMSEMIHVLAVETGP